MPPKFSLQSILDFRHSRVEIIEIELGQLLTAQQQALNFIEMLQVVKVQLFAELNVQQFGEVDLVRVAQLRANLKAIETQIAQQQAELKAVTAQVAAKQREVIGARQDEKVLAILKGKEIERYHAHLIQEENRLQDDIYIAQAFRSRVVR